MATLGSGALQGYAERLSRSLREHTQEAFPPDARKTLRNFSMRETADYLGVNQNTFRAYIKSYEGRMPTGTLVNGSRRQFSGVEMDEIRQFLWQEGKIDLKEYRRRQPGEKLQVITMVNLKGGVAKTTLATSVAQGLGLLGYRVLVVDLDAQASLTNLFGLTPEADPDMPTVYDVIRFRDPLPMQDVIRKTYFPTIDILPVSMDVIEFEYETALSFRDPETVRPFHGRISEALAQVDGDYDVVLIDSPPQMSFAVISALFASTGILVPLTASMLDMMSLSTFLSMTSDLMQIVESQSYEKSFDFVRFILTRFESTDQPQVQVASYLRTVLGKSVMGPEFVKSTAIGDAANTAQPIFEVDPREMNRRTYDRVMESIGRIIEDLERDLAASWGRS